MWELKQDVWPGMPCASENSTVQLLFRGDTKFYHLNNPFLVIEIRNTPFPPTNLYNEFAGDQAFC